MHADLLRGKELRGERALAHPQDVVTLQWFLLLLETHRKTQVKVRTKLPNYSVGLRVFKFIVQTLKPQRNFSSFFKFLRNFSISQLLK